MASHRLTASALEAIERELTSEDGWTEPNVQLCGPLAWAGDIPRHLQRKFDSVLSVALGLLVGETQPGEKELAGHAAALLRLQIGREVHQVREPRQEYCAPQEPACTVRFSPQFRKDIKSLDAKLRGRILVALTEVSDEPTAARGDTIKALHGEKALYRYRIGDYRLIYRALAGEHVVEVVTFASRGSVYG